MSYKVGMVSLGCSKNQVDGEMLLATVQQAGYTLCNSEEGGRRSDYKYLRFY